MNWNQKLFIIILCMIGYLVFVIMLVLAGVSLQYAIYSVSVATLMLLAIIGISLLISIIFDRLGDRN